MWTGDQPRPGGPSLEADGPAAEKEPLHAAERDTEENRRRREEFFEKLGTIPSEKLIFLDESGVTTCMTRLYARVPGVARVHEGAPEGDWKIFSILGAMSSRGVIAAMTVEAATDGEILLTYLDEVLCPQLQPGDVVVMDNLSSHKVDGVRQRIEARQAELLYLHSALFSRLEPNRKSLVQNQANPSTGQVTHCQGARPSHCSGHPSYFTRKRASVVPALLLRYVAE